MRNIATAAIIGKLKYIFARHGIPEIVKSNNGPHYSSAEFSRGSPTYPKSNGLAERTVQTIKTTTEKAKHDNRDPYLAILEQHTMTTVVAFFAGK